MQTVVLVELEWEFDSTFSMWVGGWVGRCEGVTYA